MKAHPVEWREGDAGDELAGAMIVGRGLAVADGGGQFHVLIVDVGVYEPKLRAVYWKRSDDGGTFELVEVAHG